MPGQFSVAINSKTLPANEKAFITTISSVSPDISVAADLSHRFQSLICDRDIGALQPWLDDAVTGPMSSFARGIRGSFDELESVDFALYRAGTPRQCQRSSNGFDVAKD
ncbi:hypothetical protein [Xaviernesmea oryzae]|uniref:hypothetical protein n=1 Tax=Xaviernesmea oryzae TaxID=464029 RepID=UPI001F205267|nr:hypothetical protein [Xaviernesmea oryzae]